jgi:MFS family permease
MELENNNNMVITVMRRYPRAVIVIAQLFGTSLWFSVNGVWLPLSQDLGLTEADLGLMTLAVQCGFIVGTLALAITGLADRFGASRIFAVSCVLGAIVNAGFALAASHSLFGFSLRFATGLCLAGIYPLGMKMIIAWTPKYSGAALAWLVGMLTLGTALPHLMRGIALTMPWQWPLLGSSLLAIAGGALVLLLGDGPHLPKSHGPVPLRQGLIALRSMRFRAVVGGYVGHMWELYAFWMLTPLLVGRELQRLNLTSNLIPGLAFAVIASGALGCIGGGWLGRRYGSEWVARRVLMASGLVCLCYPFLSNAPPIVLLILLFVWGLTIVADSPQFSALAATHAPPRFIGSSLAVMNATGFGLTLPAIWIVGSRWEVQGIWVLAWLWPGPFLGLLALRGLKQPARQL